MWFSENLGQGPRAMDDPRSPPPGRTFVVSLVDDSLGVSLHIPFDPPPLSSVRRGSLPLCPLKIFDDLFSSLVEQDGKDRLFYGDGTASSPQRPERRRFF